MSNEKTFKPCGQGENICNCKSKEDCGYKAKNWPESHTPLSAEEPKPFVPFTQVQKDCISKAQDIVAVRHEYADWAQLDMTDQEQHEIDDFKASVIDEVAIEYGILLTAQLRQQVDELQKDLNRKHAQWENQKQTIANFHGVYHDLFGYSDSPDSDNMRQRIAALKERNEKMERAAQDFLKEADDLMTFCVDRGYLDPEDESIDGIKTFNEAFENLKQSLNNE